MFAGVGAYGVWLGLTEVGPRPGSDGRLLVVGFAVMCGLVLLLHLWLAAEIKRVETDGEFLYVSNYGREIAVPLAEVAGVWEMRWMQPYWMTIRLNYASEFGDRIIFIPPFRWGAFWLPNPLVDELLDMASRARRGW